MTRKVKITIKKLGKNRWGVFKNGKKLVERDSKSEAMKAAKHLGEYYRLGKKRWEEEIRMSKDPTYRIKRNLDRIFGF